MIGLGAMGLPMATTLAAKGFDVVGFDVDAGRRAMFTPAVAALEEVAGCDCVLLSLPNDAIVSSVMEALAAILAPGTVVIDTSTIGPDTARAMSEAAASAGLGYIDAPVSGGAAGAASGQLLMMVGGAEETIAKVRPVLDAMSKKVALCGGPGSGAVVKLANNMLCSGHLLLAGEALRIAAANGVAPEAMLDAVNSGSGRSAVTEVNLPRWVLSGAFDSAFSLGLMAKDMKLAAAVPGAGRLAGEVAERCAAAADEMGRDTDFNHIVERPA